MVVLTCHGACRVPATTRGSGFTFTSARQFTTSICSTRQLHDSYLTNCPAARER